MKLSDGEKLILVMLSEIHDKLKIENGIDPIFVKSAIEQGHVWALQWRYRGIPFESRDDDTPDTALAVVDILAMWDILESSCKKLSPEEKERVETDAAPFGHDVTFRGFEQPDAIARRRTQCVDPVCRNR